MTTGSFSPKGADEVREALVAAAARLLGHLAPKRISGRVLAEEAGVNYGLYITTSAGRRLCSVRGSIVSRSHMPPGRSWMPRVGWSHFLSCGHQNSSGHWPTRRCPVKPTAPT